MNLDNCCTDKTKTAINVIAILAAFFLVAGLVWAMKRYAQPAPLGVERAELRRKALSEIRGAIAESSQSYGWLDKGKGIIRLPVDEAVKITIREWKNPEAARAAMQTRVDKALTKPPEKPSEYE